MKMSKEDLYNLQVGDVIKMKMDTDRYSEHFISIVTKIGPMPDQPTRYYLDDIWSANSGNLEDDWVLTDEHLDDFEFDKVLFNHKRPLDVLQEKCPEYFI